jgi:hypothetical protein
MQKDDLLSIPAVVVSGFWLSNIPLEQWVVIGTLGLIILQGVLLSRKIYLSFARKNNKKKRRISDEN